MEAAGTSSAGRDLSNRTGGDGTGQDQEVRARVKGGGG